MRKIIANITALKSCTKLLYCKYCNECCFQKIQIGKIIKTEKAFGLKGCAINCKYVVATLTDDYSK